MSGVGKDVLLFHHSIYLIAVVLRVGVPGQNDHGVLEHSPSLRVHVGKHFRQGPGNGANDFLRSRVGLRVHTAYGKPPLESSKMHAS